MNEIERSSQLSSLFDGQLPPEQVGMVVRRAMKDPQLRASWSRYAMIGAVLREEPLAVRSRLTDDVASRVAARLSAEPPLLAVAAASRPLQRREARSQFARGAWGMALAASVALASLVVLRSQALSPTPGLAPAGLTAQTQQGAEASPVAVSDSAPGNVPGNVQVAAVIPASDASAEALPSYTTPVSSADAARFDQPLVNYVVAHSEVATSAVRLSPLSSVMSAEQDITLGTVEMTEAEIGAHR